MLPPKKKILLKSYLDKSYNKDLFNLFKKTSLKHKNIDLDDLDNLPQDVVEKIALDLGYNSYEYNGEKHNIAFDTKLSSTDFFNKYGIRKEHVGKNRYQNLPIALKSTLFGYNPQIAKDYALMMKSPMEVDITHLMERAVAPSQDFSESGDKHSVQHGDYEYSNGTTNKNRLDSFLLYAGIPQFYNSYNISKYKPNGAKDKDAIYFDVNDRTGLVRPPEDSYYFNKEKGRYEFKDSFLQRQNSGSSASTVRSSSALRQGFFDNDNYISKEEVQKLIKDPNFSEKIKEFREKTFSLPIGDDEKKELNIGMSSIYNMLKPIEHITDNPLTAGFNVLSDSFQQVFNKEGYYADELEKLADRKDILLRQDKGQRFWNFKTQINKDSGGRYASFYDRWDLAPIAGVEGVTDAVTGGIPFEFYSRDYYPMNKQELLEKKKENNKINNFISALNKKPLKVNDFREIARDKTEVRKRIK